MGSQAAGTKWLVLGCVFRRDFISHSAPVMRRATDYSCWFGYWFQTLLSPSTRVNAGLNEAIFSSFIEKNGMWSHWALIWQWMVVFSIIVTLVQAKLVGFSHPGYHHVMLKPLVVPSQRQAKRETRCTSRVTFFLGNIKILAESSSIYMWHARGGVTAKWIFLG